MMAEDNQTYVKGYKDGLKDKKKEMLDDEIKLKELLKEKIEELDFYETNEYAVCKIIDDVFQERLSKLKKKIKC